jgi:hypothetical protein
VTAGAVRRVFCHRIAYGVLYLAPDESKFVPGSERVIDGGLLAHD